LIRRIVKQHRDFDDKKEGNKNSIERRVIKTAEIKVII
jgi:hypothetical protein